MPRLVFIKGCGPMVCSTYGEITAAIDRAFTAPNDRPVPMGAAFASLAAESNPSPLPERKSPQNDHDPRRGPPQSRSGEPSEVIGDVTHKG